MVINRLQTFGTLIATNVGTGLQGCAIRRCGASVIAQCTLFFQCHGTGTAAKLSACFYLSLAHVGMVFIEVVLELLLYAGALRAAHGNTVADVVLRECGVILGLMFVELLNGTAAGAAEFQALLQIRITEGIMIFLVMSAALSPLFFNICTLRAPHCYAITHERIRRIGVVLLLMRREFCLFSFQISPAGSTLAAAGIFTGAQLRHVVITRALVIFVTLILILTV